MTDTKKMPETTPAKIEKNITDHVLTRINQFTALGEMKLPNNYSAENALKSAWLVLLETQTRDKKPVLEACSKESISNALFDMIVQGLSPMKKQCDFIAYSNKLTLQREYHGTVALAKRYGEVIGTPTANVIYEGDEFRYEIDPITGLKKIIAHIQDFENIDTNKIRGAYATLQLSDGSQFIEIMNMAQIRQAWSQGATKGQSPAHKNFPDRMACKTVISRACTLFITTSDDGALFEGESQDPQTDAAKRAVKEGANKTELAIEEAEEVKEPKKVVIKPEKRPDLSPRIDDMEERTPEASKPKGPNF